MPGGLPLRLQDRPDGRQLAPRHQHPLQRQLLPVLVEDAVAIRVGPAGLGQQRLGLRRVVRVACHAFDRPQRPAGDGAQRTGGDRRMSARTRRSPARPGRWRRAAPGARARHPAAAVWCSGGTAPTGRESRPDEADTHGWPLIWSASLGGSSPITSVWPESSAGSRVAGSA